LRIQTVEDPNNKFSTDMMFTTIGFGEGPVYRINPNGPQDIEIQDGNIDDWDAMIDINVKGLLYVTKAIVPGMVERGTGHVVNIGSIAGKEVYPNGNVYCASKHAVDAINNGMRLDLVGTGVKVSQVCPGLVETEFSMVRFKGDQDKSKSVYQGFDALTAHDVADLIRFIVTRPAHVNISDTMILPTAQVASTIVDKK